MGYEVKRETRIHTIKIDDHITIIWIKRPVDLTWMLSTVYYDKVRYRGKKAYSVLDSLSINSEDYYPPKGA